MFKNIFILLFFFLQISFSRDYFVHLTNKGLTHRQDLLKSNFSFLTSFNISQVSKNNTFYFNEIIPSANRVNFIQNWLQLSIKQEDLHLVQALKNEQIIDYDEPVGNFKIDFASNDSLAHQQWYLDKIDLMNAWLITEGTSDIIVSVIDTGIDYFHPDLNQSIWVNNAEDLNGDSRLDTADQNGIDDDGNGFVDDVIGWDFTDAPRFEDGGDFDQPDNNPMDEFGTGHGTQVAGIIAAKANNITGIAGVAPGVKIMNLRAGTASGYLEEDDVARAVLYAVENGAHIINMSFGDTALSRFLRDIIHYASEQGVVIVASAGNSSSNEVHYPSGLVETISVGSTNQNDVLSGFSNFGNSIDLVAPGSEIISTAIGSGYNIVNGTSFSAPIISGVAALLLSQNPQMTPKQVRNILKSSAQDILFNGWDEFSGAGRVSAFNALNIPHGGVLEVTSPLQNRTVADQVIVIVGSAAHPDLIKTTVDYGLGKTPEDWFLLRTIENRQIINDTLAVLNTSSLVDTVFTIRVKMDVYNNLSDELHLTVSIDRSAPIIRNITTTPLWDKTNPSMLISFDTDDTCISKILLRQKGSDKPYIAIASPYETNNHRIKIDNLQFEGELEFFIEAQNFSQLKSIADNNGINFSFSLEKDFKWQQFQKVEWNLSAGYMLNTAMDFDNDNNKEIVISRYNENSGFGPIEIYEFNNGQFDKRLQTSFTAIPRAAGDVDSDGKKDLLLGLGQFSFLLEAKDQNSFPTELVWQDTTNFWAAAYSDLDNDGQKEISGRIGGEYVILENSSDNAFDEISRLSNPTAGENRLGVPKIELSDFNNDLVNELVFGDSDGDIIVYSATGDNQFEIFSTGKTIHPNSSELITSNGKGNVITATHTAENSNFEHEFDARYWSIESFKDNFAFLQSSDTINTFGFSPTKDFDSGLKFSLFDGKEFLFASFFPELFVFEKVDGKWQPVWLNDQARSNTVLIYDFDNDGNDEFYFNDGKQIIGYTASQKNRPFAPYSFKAFPLDSIHIELKWSKVDNVDNYNIYRGETADNLSYFSDTENSFYRDTTLVTGQKYFYSITSVDSTFEIKESYFSIIDSAQTANPPRPLSIDFINEKQLFVHFDRSLLLIESRKVSVIRTMQNLIASSVILNNSNRSLLISFDDPFIENEQDTLQITNVFGETGVPVQNSNSFIPLRYVRAASAPYVVNYEWLSENQMRIEFSEQMQILPSPFSLPIEPSGGTEKVDFVNNTSIIVTFDSKTYTGSSGQKSYLLLEGLISARGVALEDYDAISLYRESEGLSDVFIYPQPLKPNHDALFFANLPADVIIRVYTLNGTPIRRIEEQTSYGGVKWNLKDSAGKKVANGVYIYTIHWKNKVKHGKLVVIK